MVLTPIKLHRGIRIFIKKKDRKWFGRAIEGDNVILQTKMDNPEFLSPYGTGYK